VWRRQEVFAVARVCVKDPTIETTQQKGEDQDQDQDERQEKTRVKDHQLVAAHDRETRELESCIKVARVCMPNKAFEPFPPLSTALLRTRPHSAL
jgi:hypothetical protein